MLIKTDKICLHYNINEIGCNKYCKMSNILGIHITYLADVCVNKFASFHAQKIYFQIILKYLPIYKAFKFMKDIFLLNKLSVYFSLLII